MAARRIATGLLASWLILLPACIREISLPQGLEGNGTFANLTFPGENVPCNLLAKEEVDLAMNAASTVAQSKESEGRPLLVGMSMCTLVGPSEAAVSWGLLPGGAKRFNEYRTVNRRYIELTEVSKNDAFWDGGFRTLMVRSGDKVFGLRISLRSNSLEKEVNEQEYLRETAKLLANRALRRLNG